MRSADLDDALELIGFCRERRAQCLQRGQQSFVQRCCNGDIDRSGKHIVGRLSAIDVVVRVHRAADAALLTEQFGSAVRKYLVEVHVGLRSRAALP